VANDYSFDEIYARLVDGIGQEGDMLVAISTSGNSNNIVRALEIAHSKKMITVSFTGKTGGRMAQFSDFLVNIPSAETPRIQESHILVGHIICELVEARVFDSEKV
jgi:D-sedoheptulose 7-phosphate isomerase